MAPSNRNTGSPIGGPKLPEPVDVQLPEPEKMQPVRQSGLASDIRKSNIKDNKVTSDSVSATTESMMGVESRDTKSTDALIERAKQLSEQATESVQSFEPGSLPANVKYAVKVARRWQMIPDEMTDTEALMGGFITPEMLQLILTIVMAMMQDCLPNQPSLAWKRIKNFQGMKPLDRLGDETRMAWMIDRWFNRMAYPRDKGDVRMVIKSLSDEAAASSEETFRAVQTEALFMTV